MSEVSLWMRKQYQNDEVFVKFVCIRMFAVEIRK